jgi:hypothetical protein
MYMCISFLYQTGDVYVYKLRVQSRWCICVYIACRSVWYRKFIHLYMNCLVQAFYAHIYDLFGTGNLYTYTWPVWYRQFIHIYMTCLVQAIYTHIHDLLGTVNLYTYTWPAWYRQFIHIYMTCLVPKRVMYMCINYLYQAGHVYVYKLPVPNRSCICV